MPFIIIGIVIVLAIVIWVISTINSFTRKEIKIEEARSGIEVALTKRYDMLTKLLDVCKGFMKHESDLFAKVISMRQGMSVGEMGEADKQMGELAGRLFAVAESYPELRSSEAVAELQEGIRDAEEHLQAARRIYNTNVTNYNTSIKLFPGKLLAGKRSSKEFFEAEDYKKEDVKMQF